ncbi:unnamed protein product [Caenorhabditis auriculariae]|uniref:Secreted protein n=1 Tax=Caenorhabditis auriculariae TaxID=2777116 RepID=A0A8S1GR44_9PELO|nr:unnamed protein product [Caenorhabditis auriculariae]
MFGYGFLLDFGSLLVCGEENAAQQSSDCGDYPQSATDAVGRPVVAPGCASLRWACHRRISISSGFF